MRTRNTVSQWRIHEVNNLPFPPPGTGLEIELGDADRAVLRFSTGGERVELEGRRDQDRLVGSYYQGHGTFKVWEEGDRNGRRSLRCVVDPESGRPTSGSWVADEDDT